jgi:hypothetical protein
LPNLAKREQPEPRARTKRIDGELRRQNEHHENESGVRIAAPSATAMRWRTSDAGALGADSITCSVAVSIIYTVPR